MSLPPPKCARASAHTRRIVVEGFMREDGLLELDAMLEDVKSADYPLSSGVRRVGDPVHRMHVRVTLDAAFVIVDVEACSTWVPYPGACDTIGPAYRKLVGLCLVSGFRRAVSALFAGVQGCSHMTELLFSLPTVAIQTFATFRPENGDDGDKPFQLDRCHALETSGETVRRYYPKWYRRADEIE